MDGLGGQLLLALLREHAARAAGGVRTRTDRDTVGVDVDVGDLVPIPGAIRNQNHGSDEVDALGLPSSTCLHTQVLLRRGASMLSVSPSHAARLVQAYSAESQASGWLP